MALQAKVAMEHKRSGREIILRSTKAGIMEAVKREQRFGSVVRDANQCALNAGVKIVPFSKNNAHGVSSLLSFLG